MRWRRNLPPEITWLMIAVAKPGYVFSDKLTGEHATDYGTYRAAVAVRHLDQGFARIVIERQLFAFGLFGALHQRPQRLLIERFENQHARARQKRRVQLEGRVLRRGADERHGAVFHDRQKRILLGAVEAMDFVDEEQRPLPHAPTAARFLKDLLQIGNARKDR